MPGGARFWPLALCALSGCKCGSEKPYTPFGMASAAPSESVASAPPSAAPVSSGFAPKKAELAPGGVKRWNIDGTTLEAPPDRRFDQGVVADLDADGENEVVAWLLADERLPPGKLIPPAELWLFARGAPARPVLPLPSFVPTGPGCKLVTRLAQTGPRSVTLDARAVCEAALMPRAPLGALVVLAPLAEEPQIHLLRYAAEAPGEKLELAADSGDRDSDGQDDALVRVSLTFAGKTATAELSWFERAAGSSRDKTEPGRSLTRAATREAGRAKQKKTAAEVVERVALLRRLASLLCSQGGAPRLFDRDGSALSCSGLEPFVDALASAEASAELTRGDVPEAFATHSRDGWYFAPISAKQRAAVEKELLAAVSKRSVTVHRLDAAPTLPQRPRFSPLTFAPDAAVLVQTPGGVIAFDTNGAALPAADPSALPPAWPLDVSDGNTRFTTVVYACDRPEVLLSVQGGSELATRLLSPRPGLCSGAKLVSFPEVAPVAFGGGALEVVLGGSIIGKPASGALPLQGSPRSTDGRLLVTPTRLGPLVSGAEKPELWQLPGDGPKPTELSDCVVANEKKAVACLASGRPVLLTPTQ
jgi:hypothetical protein